MKRIVYWIITLWVVSSASVQAQVTIGSDKEPHPAAILDLQSSSQGLMLPKVSLTDTDTFLKNLSEEDKISAAGLLVYNDGKGTPTHLNEGLYLWTGNKWKVVLITSYQGIESGDNPTESASPEILGTN